LRRAAFIIVFFLITAAAFAQTDTAKVSDSLKTQLDTAKFAKSDINEIINYSANDSVVFDVATNKMNLYNNAEVNYKELKLNSGVIILDRQTQILDAVGIPVDSAGITKFVQIPLMYQGKEKYEGSKLTYSFRTQKGTISLGYSDADVGYYFGEKIKKVTPEVYFIKNGLYTTSTDKVDPEYYFYSPKMKMIPKDKIIAQSVFLYIEGVPIFWIPFVVLPNRSGRSSGIIIPKYGQDATYGYYLANAGYFWAINDYTDIVAKASLFAKGRYDFNSTFRYVKKYSYSGSIDGGYSLINSGESSDPNRQISDQWIINWIHNQNINPTTNLSGNVTFISGKDYYQNSTNSLPDLLRQNVVSNLTLSKYWEESPLSMTFNYYRDQNLQTGNINENLPSVSVSLSETYPFRKDAVSSNQKLYEFFSYSYSGSFLNNRTKINGGDLTSNMGAMHRINLNFSPTFKYFNIKPFFYYTEIWYNKYIEKYLNPNDSLITVENRAIKSVRYFQSGISLNTKIIGIFTPKIFNVTGIKHTLTPSITYNFTPDFSDPRWGYYRTYNDQFGNPVKYSIYEGRIYGSAPVGETQSISFAIGNLFEMKTRENDTTENKFQLFNLNASVNYNFAADSLKWSEIATDLRTHIGNLLNIGGSATFNLYKFDPASNTRVNKFLYSESGKIAELTAVSLNISSSFSFGLGKKGTTQAVKDTTIVIKDNSYKSPFEEPDVNVPLSGSFNYNFSENRQNPYNIYKSSNISGSINLNPTSRWKFSFTTSYDILNKRISAPYLTAYRDLNSWEINFNWYPLGVYRGFFFEVRIKAPSLNDIKMTKQTNSRGVYQ
jgi:lipopolysaccharide assembly outer membrane protein LptD (OstA)